MRSGALIALVIAVGCSPSPNGVGRSTSHDAVAKLYDREVQFAAPRSCALYLERRTTDEAARTSEYDAHVDGRQISIVYSIVAGDAFPLQASLYGKNGTPGFSLFIADHELQVRAPDGTILRDVARYDGPEAATTVSGTSVIGDEDGLALLGCALADRSALGDVAAFLRNLSSGGLVPGQPNVGQTNENATPILPDWKSDVSLLGAFWLAGGCLQSDGWRCDCWQAMNDPVIGPVAGWCPLRDGGQP